MNKKVLLRERKRHTARRVTSTRYAPTWTWKGGILLPLPQPGPGKEYSPPPVKVWTDTQTENITFPHPSDAGGKYREVRRNIFLL